MIVLDPRVGAAIGGAFGRTASRSRERGERSRARERRGERARREESYTDELLDDWTETLAASVDRVRSELADRGVSLAIDISPSNLPVGVETKSGADLGIRVELRTPEFTMIKGALVQCKRMYAAAGVPGFDELEGRGEKQARDMLRLTPASFFLLFNVGSQEQLLNWAGLPVGMICPIEDDPISSSLRMIASIGRNCPHWVRSAGGIWDLGIAMIPAARVLGWSASARERNRGIDVSAPRVLRGALPLGVFMVDLLTSCFVGDPREEIARIVYRDQAGVIASRGVFPEFDGFAVRRHMNITLVAEHLADEGSE